MFLENDHLCLMGLTVFDKEKPTFVESPSFVQKQSSFFFKLVTDVPVLCACVCVFADFKRGSCRQ